MEVERDFFSLPLISSMFGTTWGGESTGLNELVVNLRRLRYFSQPTLVSVSLCPKWCWVHSAGKNDLELLILLPPTSPVLESQACATMPDFLSCVSGVGPRAFIMIDKDSTTQLYPSPLRYSWSSHRDGESGMEDVKFDMICSTKMIRLKIAWRWISGRIHT